MVTGSLIESLTINNDKFVFKAGLAVLEADISNPCLIYSTLIAIPLYARTGKWLPYSKQGDNIREFQQKGATIKLKKNWVNACCNIPFF